MTLHIATINGLRMPADHFERARDRDRTIDQMATHLVAAAAGGLDLTCDRDIALWLFETPDRYSARQIHDHVDAAADAARQIIATREMVKA